MWTGPNKLCIQTEHDKVLTPESLVLIYDFRRLNSLKSSSVVWQIWSAVCPSASCSCLSVSVQRRADSAASSGWNQRAHAAPGGAAEGGGHHRLGVWGAAAGDRKLHYSFLTGEWRAGVTEPRCHHYLCPLHPLQVRLLSPAAKGRRVIMFWPVSGCISWIAEHILLTFSESNQWINIFSWFTFAVNPIKDGHQIKVILANA